MLRFYKTQTVVGIMKRLSYLFVSTLLFGLTQAASASSYSEECLRAVCEQVCGGSWDEGTCFSLQAPPPGDLPPLDDGYPPPPEDGENDCYQTLSPSSCSNVPLSELEVPENPY